MSLHLTRLREESRSSAKEWLHSRTMADKLHLTPRKAAIFNKVASYALKNNKSTDLCASKWTMDEAMDVPVNTDSIWIRYMSNSLQFVCDVYRFQTLPPYSAVVDFANAKVGGNCFRHNGFAQEEQMVAQSTDLAFLLRRRDWSDCDFVRPREIISYEGVHFDAFWSREAAAKKDFLDTTDIQHISSVPLIVLAAAAPSMRGYWYYDKRTLQELADTTRLIMAAATHLRCPCLCTGLLGGRAFRGNRPLVITLHCLCHDSDSPKMFMHIPIFSSHSVDTTAQLEDALVQNAECMLYVLRESGVTSMTQVIDCALAWNLPTSHGDRDLQRLDANNLFAKMLRQRKL